MYAGYNEGVERYWRSHWPCCCKPQHNMCVFSTLCYCLNSLHLSHLIWLVLIEMGPNLVGWWRKLHHHTQPIPVLFHGTNSLPIHSTSSCHQGNVNRHILAPTLMRNVRICAWLALQNLKQVRYLHLLGSRFKIQGTTCVVGEKRACSTLYFVPTSSKDPSLWQK